MSGHDLRKHLFSHWRDVCLLVRSMQYQQGATALAATAENAQRTTGVSRRCRLADNSPDLTVDGARADVFMRSDSFKPGASPSAGAPQKCSFGKECRGASLAESIYEGGARGLRRTANGGETSSPGVVGTVARNPHLPHGRQRHRNRLAMPSPICRQRSNAASDIRQLPEPEPPRVFKRLLGR
jgi:hypothetical protein